MAQLNCIPGTPMGHPLPKVYLFCRPLLRERHTNTLIQAIRDHRNCDIYWADAPIPDQERGELLSDMQLFVLPVDFQLLEKSEESIDHEVAFALRNHIPLLPVLMEPDIYPLYSLPHKFGTLPCLRYCREDDSFLPFAPGLQLALDMLLLPDRLLAEASGNLKQLPAGSRKELLKGVAALAGIRQRRQPDTGMKHLYKAARSGLAEAVALSLRIYNIGIGIPQNQRMALQYAIRATDAFLAQESLSLSEQTPDQLLDLALLCIPMERQDLSIRIMAKLTDALEDTLGVTHDLTLMYRDILSAFCRQYRRDDFFMVQLCRKQYQATLQKFGENHPDTRERLRKVALYCDKAANPQQAMEHYRTLVISCREHLGENAPETLSALYHIAGQCQRMRLFSHTRQLCETVYKLQSSELGSRDPAAMDTLELLCEALLELGEQADLASYLRKLHSGRRMVLGSEHPKTLSVLLKLALRYHGAGQKSRAIRTVRDAHNGYLRLYGEEYPKTKQALELLHYILHNSGDGNT